MGILEPSLEEDVQLVTELAVWVAEFWNENGGPDHGFEVAVGEAQIREVCQIAEVIFGHCFPSSPSPFKRVAALIVLGQLFPYFALGKFKNGKFQQNENVATSATWIPRILALMVPAALSVMSVNVSRNSKENWVPLSKWIGFPSKHFKIEFLTFIKWLDTFGYDKPLDQWDGHTKNRLARAILAMSLIIESVYYACEGGVLDTEPAPEHVRGKCDRFDSEDLTAITYDVPLWTNFSRQNPPPP